MKINSVSRTGGGGAEGVEETTRTEQQHEESAKPTLLTTPTATKSLEPTRRSSRTVRRSSKVSVTPSPPTHNGKRKTQVQAKMPNVKTSNKSRLISTEKNPDVVFGRGGAANAYRQNSLYHALLAEKWKTYSDLGRNEQHNRTSEQNQSKRAFAVAQVIDVILQAGGNFFIIGWDGVKRRMDPNKDMPEIIRKVMQALRDCRTKRVPGQSRAVSINFHEEDKYADDDDNDDDNDDDHDDHNDNHNDDDEGMANDGREKSDSSQSEKEEEDDNDDDGDDEDNDEDVLLTVDELVAKKKSARTVLFQGFQLGLDVIFGQGGLYNQLRKESLYKALLQRCSKEYKTLKIYKEKRRLAMEKIMSVIIQAGGTFWISTDGGMKLLDHTKSDVQNTILAKIIQAFRDRSRGRTGKQVKVGIAKKKKAKAIAKTSIPSVKPREESPTSQTIQSRKVASSLVEKPSRPLLDQPTPTRTHKNRMTFPKKLYNMLSGGKIKKLIDWSKDGKYILIFQPNELVEALPHFMLDQSTIRSFHRQLSIWGFTRISKGKNVRALDETERWQHPMFYRGMPFENFSSIVRGGSSTNRKDISAQTPSPSQKRKNAPSSIAGSSEMSKRVKMSTEPKKKKANSKIRASAIKAPSQESSTASTSSKTVMKASKSSKTVKKASISSKTVTKASKSSKTVTNDVSYHQWLSTYLPPTPSVARGIHESSAFLLSATPPTPTAPTKQQDKEENEEGFWAFPHVVPLPYTLPPASRPPLPSADTGMFDDAPDDPTLHWYHNEFKEEEESSSTTNIPNTSTIPAVHG